MARQNMRPQPWLKNMEGYTDFSGGLNTQADYTKMMDSEMADISNMEITPRGSLARRTGIVHDKRRATWGDIKGYKWGDLNG